jgi:hypothetical protein
MSETRTEDAGADTVTGTMLDGLLFMGTSRDELLARSGTPPPVLYHYTVIEPALSIIQTNELWATNAVFMNDESEIRYAADILRRVSEDVVNDPEFISVDQGNLSRAMLPVHRVLANLHSYIEVYVSCFSSEQDQLSQWRAYGQSGGLSIGFDASQLKRIMADHPGILALVQISYNETEHSQRIYSLVKAWILMYLESLERDVRTKPHVDAMFFAQSFAWHAISMKNSAFGEEKEWRLVWVRPRLPHTLPDEPFEINFRVANDMAVPHIRFLPRDAEGTVVRLPIVSVRVGPHKYPDLAASGVWHLVTSEGLADSIYIDYSRTPLRT